ncbi:MAG: hypothetical protein OXC42_07430, partial [Gammaproteobacteria bacterium]|nr:hypothetical protein [Gammaproteobacteria bacterium]
EHCLGNPRTVARVSGERLSARTGDSSVLLGAGGTWRKGNLVIDAGLSTREGLDTASEDYSATLSLGMQF